MSIIRINAKGLCQKCNRLKKPYFILNSKCLCFNHLPDKEKNKVKEYNKIKKRKHNLIYRFGKRILNRG